MTVKELKSKSDKLKETIHILKQIKYLGIPETEPAYLEIKNYMSEWVKSEDRNIKEYTIEFYRFGRKGILTLPWRSDKPCEFVLKKAYGF